MTEAEAIAHASEVLEQRTQQTEVDSAYGSAATCYSGQMDSSSCNINIIEYPGFERANPASQSPYQIPEYFQTLSAAIYEEPFTELSRSFRQSEMLDRYGKTEQQGNHAKSVEDLRTAKKSAVDPSNGLPVPFCPHCGVSIPHDRLECRKYRKPKATGRAYATASEGWRQGLSSEATTNGSPNSGFGKYHMQDQSNDPEEYEQQLEASIDIWGKEHPNTIKAMSNLAATYHQRGRWKEAGELHIRVLQLQREALGKQHSETIGSLIAIIARYYHQDRLEEVESILEKVMQSQPETLGVECFDKIKSMTIVAAESHQLGLSRLAGELMFEVLRLRRRLLGEKHPDTIDSAAQYATICHQQQGLSEPSATRDRTPIGDAACVDHSDYERTDKLNVQVNKHTSPRMSPDSANSVTTVWDDSSQDEEDSLPVDCLSALFQTFCELQNELPEMQFCRSVVPNLRKAYVAFYTTTEIPADVSSEYAWRPHMSFTFPEAVLLQPHSTCADTQLMWYARSRNSQQGVSPPECDEGTGTGRHDVGATSAGSANIVGSSSSSLGDRKRKVNRPARERDDGNQDEDEDGSPRRRKTPRKVDQEENHPRLACPFYKIDPKKYANCRVLKMTAVNYVKQHLWRCHLQPLHCRSCYQNFENEEDLTQHEKLRICDRLPWRQVEGISPDKRHRLKIRGSAKNSIEENWFLVFDILFPESGRPSSPYVDPSICVHLDLLNNFVNAQGGRLAVDLARSYIIEHGGPSEGQIVDWSQSLLRYLVNTVLDEMTGLPRASTTQQCQPQAAARVESTASSCVQPPRRSHDHSASSSLPKSDDSPPFLFTPQSGSSQSAISKDLPAPSVLECPVDNDSTWRGSISTNSGLMPPPSFSYAKRTPLSNDKRPMGHDSAFVSGMNALTEQNNVSWPDQPSFDVTSCFYDSSFRFDLGDVDLLKGFDGADFNIP
ncbi:hypothetical protein AAFC00_003330 [Neodothiora populina]|uniref:Uncharacterized protein n=1 Tax=Neodothiora populina TaxID=2781224 RepID=A0ABR3PA26_9PEZI